MSLLTDVWGDSWKSTNTTSNKPFLGGNINKSSEIQTNLNNNSYKINNSQLIINNLLKENNILKNKLQNKNFINYDDENLASSVLLGYFLLFVMDTFVDLGKQMS